MDTFCFAGFRDCRLLELHLLVLSHSLPCGLTAAAYHSSISRFSPERRARFCFFQTLTTVPGYSMGPGSRHLWVTRCASEHPYLLSTAHSSQPCLSCGHQLRSFAHPFGLRAKVFDQMSTFFCGDRTHQQPAVHVFPRLHYRTRLRIPVLPRSTPIGSQA